MYLKRFINSHRSPFRFLAVQAFIVGLLTGLVWIVFDWAISIAIHSRETIVSATSFMGVKIALAMIVSAAMVALAMYLARHFAPETLGGGISFMEGVLDGVLPLRPWRILTIKPLGSMLILASGMPLGPEGPIVQMGGAIGGLIGKVYRVSEERVKILAASGIGAAMAAAFNAPLGGIIVVMEEFQPEFENPVEAWHSVTFSVVGATLIIRAIIGAESVFSIERFSTPPFYSLWIFAVLGIFLGILGYLFNRLFFWFSDQFSLLSGSGIALGAFIGALTLIAPSVTGDGFDTVTDAFNNHDRGWVILLIFASRFILTILCGATGASGGIYMPLLGLATLFSLGFAKEIQHWFPGFLPHPEILAIAGTSALISATSRTPIAAIIITVEITDNYELLLAMIVCSLFAEVTTQKLGGEPIFTVLLRKILQKNSS
jgi:CIC family chloride channel protein